MAPLDKQVGDFPALNERTFNMTKEKIANYSIAQTALIVAAAESNGGVLNLDIAKSLAANPAMNDNDGNPRNYRSIVAKIARMVASGEVASYERKVPTTKDGKPVTKKTDLVARIATAAGVNVAKLDGMDKSPKLALETIVAALEARETEGEESEAA